MNWIFYVDSKLLYFIYLKIVYETFLLFGYSTSPWNWDSTVLALCYFAAAAFAIVAYTPSACNSNHSGIVRPVQPHPVVPQAHLYPLHLDRPVGLVALEYQCPECPGKNMTTPDNYHLKPNIIHFSCYLLECPVDRPDRVGLQLQFPFRLFHLVHLELCDVMHIKAKSKQIENWI